MGVRFDVRFTPRHARKDGRIKGSIRIKGGDWSTFVAVRTEEADESVPPSPS